ncbi:hypothetical protein CRYUN_Cryun20dG0026600 [Craigia yunnanensis]
MMLDMSSPKEDPELSKEEKKPIMGGSISKEPVKPMSWCFSQVLKFNLTESGLFSVLPWLTMAAFANIGGWIANTVVSKGLSITAVCKGSDAFSQSGLYSNHQYIGPRYAVSFF